MSQETLEWLNSMTLIGFTEARGNAWHWRESLQNGEPNHYPGAIPVDDVLRRLFNFQVIEKEIYLPKSLAYVKVPNYKAMVTDDDATVLGIFKSGYEGHQYDAWLINEVAKLLDDDLAISSAGLLKNRAVGWVEVSVPEVFKAAGDVEFRANLLSGTSFDGSLATTFGRTITNTVCDNTMAAAFIEAHESGQVVKIRHSRYSPLRITEAREALKLVYQIADEFGAEVGRLLDWPVSTREWELTLDALVPVPEEAGRGRTLAETKRAELGGLWVSDPRVAPWKGTAWGAVQAFNTWGLYGGSVRGGEAGRGMRNQVKLLNGEQGKEDRRVVEVLGEVCGESRRPGGVLVAIGAGRGAGGSVGAGDVELEVE